MQSIFTFDHDPPRVSSPWRSTSASNIEDSKELRSSRSSDIDALINDLESIHFASSDDLSVEKLEAEPQQGPTEYKVHLLLRPRRTFFATSNAKYAAGSQHSKTQTTTPRTPPEHTTSNALPLAQSSATRQHRLEQLTTQLLWRLQQSSTFHASAADNVIFPTFPQAEGDLLEPRTPSKLLPGLEESNGALYEIGVSDDGSFVGLTREEMRESLNNLQAMSACLGCATIVLRLVKVGQAESIRDVADTAGGETTAELEDLWVAEAYIKPLLSHSQAHSSTQARFATGVSNPLQTKPTLLRTPSNSKLPSAQEQLRVTLAGATTSGKSSLLGTLSTSTLDNGRGRSRLTMLKHRHEIASGMTSSVTQELIGYDDSADNGADLQQVNVINYATSNVSSWNDIHARSSNGRLAFLSDSAGHPRYRRTIVRGLLGWAPHWTLLCLPASNGSDRVDAGVNLREEQNQGAFAGASAHISMAQLDVCLRLDLALMIAITKLDAASKANFREVLSALLSRLKRSGRKPILLANDTAEPGDMNLHFVSAGDLKEVQRVVDLIIREGHTVVPILFTSAVNGTGVGKLHALLRYIPIGPTQASSSEIAKQPTPSSMTIFHVDDAFRLMHGSSMGGVVAVDVSKVGSVMSGHLAQGKICIGQEMLLGPFSAQIERPQEDSEDLPPPNPDDPFLAPRSFSDALARITAPSLRFEKSRHDEWRRVRVVSIRNLRLPSQTLSADRVGTIGVIPVDDTSQEKRLPIRRGMVLTDIPLGAAHTVTASFDISDASSLVVGNRVVIYSASVRSSAKIVAVALQNSENMDNDKILENVDVAEDPAFAMDDDASLDTAESCPSLDHILVTLQLESYREWIGVGAKLLVMPGGGPGIHAGDRGIKGLAGLEGFVGQVVETFG
ncbi:MAG: hypothetical protein Q9162_001633 [Coniocarpon cinnabarinum]